jgi:DNA-binding GntR family transcriptional regulator
MVDHFDHRPPATAVVARPAEASYGFHMNRPAPRRGRKTAGHRGHADSSVPDAADRVDNVSQAYRNLRGAIVWGQLSPGLRISERAIAEWLGLSRTPVRSALHRLEQEGFVSSYGNGRERRLVAAPLTLADGQEVYFIVGHLEGLAARTAAGLPASRRKKLVARMRELNRELAAESRKRGDASRVFDLDLEFHRTYVEGVVGPRLLTLHRAIKPQSERYSRLYISVLLDELSSSVKEHEAIVRSIADGDPDAAQRTVETNWSNAAARLARIIEQHGERGSWQAWGYEPGAVLGKRRDGKKR